MKAYDEIWGVAEDNFGIITMAKAKELGVSRQNVSAMVKSGLLTRVAQGVYQVKHHVPGVNDVYAVCVAMAGDSAYLRGASVVALLNLAPTSPSEIYIGAARRVRRRLPAGVHLRDMSPSPTTEYEGVRCQIVYDALKTSRDEGTVEADRIAEAATEANLKGYLSDAECAEFQNEP